MRCLYCEPLRAFALVFQALRVSMEEQRARQEDEARKTVASTVGESGGQPMEGEQMVA